MGDPTSESEAQGQEYVLTLTPRQAEFVHRVGRHLRKQEGWWDGPEWENEYAELHAMFEALPWNASDLAGEVVVCPPKEGRNDEV